MVSVFDAKRNDPFASLFHREADSLAFQVHAQDFDHDLLLEGDYLGGVLDELSGGQLRNVNQSFYVNADIYERAKIGYVAYYAGKFHSGFYVLNGVDLV